MEDYVAEEKVDRADPIGKCWTLITQSLHDDLFLKLVHVEHGLIATLMLEIRAALLVNIAEDIQPLRLELYGASMQRDCTNDLQTFIAYITYSKARQALISQSGSTRGRIGSYFAERPALNLPTTASAFLHPGKQTWSFHQRGGAHPKIQRIAHCVR